MAKTKQMYIIHDERADADPEKAEILDTADTLEEAKKSVRELFEDMGVIVYLYDIIDNEFKNGREVYRG